MSTPLRDSDSDDAELAAAMELALSGELDAAAAAALAQRIAADPQLRRRWQEAVAMDVQLRVQLRPPQARRIAEGARRVVSVATSTRRFRIVRTAHRRRRQAHSRLLLWGSVAVAASVIGALLLVAIGSGALTQPAGPDLRVLSGAHSVSGTLAWGAEAQTHGPVRLRVGASEVSLDPGSRLRFTGLSDDPQGTITLLAGGGEWRIPPHAGHEVVVRSPHLRVRVTGTAFSLTSGEHSHLRLHSGRVELRHAQGAQIYHLEAGEEMFATVSGLHREDPTAPAPAPLPEPEPAVPWWTAAVTSRGSHADFSWHGSEGRLRMQLQIAPGVDGFRSWGGVQLPIAVPDGRVVVILDDVDGDPGAEWSINVTEADGDVWLVAYGLVSDQPQRLEVDLTQAPQRLQFQAGDGDYDPRSIRFISIGLAKGNGRLGIRALDPPALLE